MAKQTKTAKQKVSWIHPWTRRQYVVIGIGVAVIITGFFMLAASINTSWDNPLSVNVAPVVLVIGYCVIIPIGIMIARKPGDKGTR
ncbi:MAG: hypothetical protein HYX66_10220 [Ignavibacteria bacterium]|jgi:hypothetical protein|nr:hypothetical protein [Ignavibacteria bacterium]